MGGCQSNFQRKSDNAERDPISHAVQQYRSCWYVGALTELREFRLDTFASQSLTPNVLKELTQAFAKLDETKRPRRWMLCRGTRYDSKGFLRADPNTMKVCPGLEQALDDLFQILPELQGLTVFSSALWSTRCVFHLFQSLERCKHKFLHLKLGGFTLRNEDEEVFDFFGLGRSVASTLSCGASVILTGSRIGHEFVQGFFSVNIKLCSLELRETHLGGGLPPQAVQSCRSLYWTGFEDGILGNECFFQALRMSSALCKLSVCGLNNHLSNDFVKALFWALEENDSVEELVFGVKFKPSPTRGQRRDPGPIPRGWETSLPKLKRLRKLHLCGLDMNDDIKKFVLQSQSLEHVEWECDLGQVVTGSADPEMAAILKCNQGTARGQRFVECESSNPGYVWSSIAQQLDAPVAIFAFCKTTAAHIPVLFPRTSSPQTSPADGPQRIHLGTGQSSLPHHATRQHRSTHRVKEKFRSKARIHRR